MFMSLVASGYFGVQKHAQHRVSEWLSLTLTSGIEDHVIHISHVIITYTLESFIIFPYTDGTKYAGHNQFCEKKE